jgi:hypothetical protein
LDANLGVGPDKIKRAVPPDRAVIPRLAPENGANLGHLADRDVMQDYQQLSCYEVLRLVFEKDQLTDEARVALDAEVARRGLSQDDFIAFKVEEAAAMRAREKSFKELPPIRPTRSVEDERITATTPNSESRNSIPHCGS